MKQRFLFGLAMMAIIIGLSNVFLSMLGEPSTFGACIVFLGLCSTASFATYLSAVAFIRWAKVEAKRSPQHFLLLCVMASNMVVGGIVAACIAVPGIAIGVAAIVNAIAAAFAAQRVLYG